MRLHPPEGDKNKGDESPRVIWKNNRTPIAKLPRRGRRALGGAGQIPWAGQESPKRGRQNPLGWAGESQAGQAKFPGLGRRSLGGA